METRPGPFFTFPRRHSGACSGGVRQGYEMAYRYFAPIFEKCSRVDFTPSIVSGAMGVPLRLFALFFCRIDHFRLVEPTLVTLTPLRAFWRWIAIILKPFLESVSKNEQKYKSLKNECGDAVWGVEGIVWIQEGAFVLRGLEKHWWCYRNGRYRIERIK